MQNQTNIDNYRDVSEIIDSYWLASPDEIAHRKKLASLIQQWILPHDRLLEAGCGSGLVYRELVPEILSNTSYTGVDISKAMLELAQIRFKEGAFLREDLYGLSFSDNSFDIVAAFEVFGHIGDIEKPIQEMFRTASRLMMFTVWTAPESKIDHEIIGDEVFLHKIFSDADITKAIEVALEDKLYAISRQPISEKITAYIIHKK